MYSGMFGFSFQVLGYASVFRFAAGFDFGVVFQFRIGFGSSLSIGGDVRLCAVIMHKLLICCGMFVFSF